jgi:hypothetical protein
MFNGSWAEEGFTGNANVALAVWLAVSLTVTVKLTVPGAGGVPVSSPVGLSVNQAGCWLSVHT